MQPAGSDSKKSSPRSAFEDFRRFFLRGLAALLPTLLTIALFFWTYHLVEDHVGRFITEGLMLLCSSISDEPAPGLVDAEIDPIKYGTPIDEWDSDGRRLTIEHKYISFVASGASMSLNEEAREEAQKNHNRALWRIAFAKHKLHLLGFLIAIVLVYFVGFFLASFIGRASWRVAEGLLGRIPVVRAVYPNIKQVTDFLLSEQRIEFSSVVAVEYPRRGVWSLGLTTGRPMKDVQRDVSDELITVFIPSSPTPVTGYVIQVPRKDVIELNLSIDEGLRFTISAGVIKPEATLSKPLSGQEKA